MAYKILHLLSQRPSLTGSGVSLDSVVRHAAAAGWSQRVVVGVPANDPAPSVGGLEPRQIHPLVFGVGTLPFQIPGMSDVMPYESSRFSSLDAGQLDAYREAWRRHVGAIVAEFQPDVIHSRHIWLLSSVVKDIAPNIPVITHCHATGLRQMRLCPHLADEVRRGCARNERFAVLHRGHAEALRAELGVSADRIHVVGAGYRQDIFHDRGRPSGAGDRIVYAGKYSRAKGLPQLLDAVERLIAKRPKLVLHVAGDGAGEEAESLRTRMAAMSPHVITHGQLSQTDLAKLFRASDVFVLPSFYEGQPLVLVEALACGCRPICTDIPGVREGLGDQMRAAVEWTPMPRLIGPDAPLEADLPKFVADLANAIDRTLSKPAVASAEIAMADFTWEAVFKRIETVWLQLIG